MPYLIKSSGGQRSCQLLANRDLPGAELREDLIEALKGMTIKFEIKIVDVLQTQSETSESAESVSGANQTITASVQPSSLVINKTTTSSTINNSNINSNKINTNNGISDQSQPPLNNGQVAATAAAAAAAPQAEPAQREQQVVVPPKVDKPRSAVSFGPLSSIKPPPGYQPVRSRRLNDEVVTGKEEPVAVVAQPSAPLVSAPQAKSLPVVSEPQQQPPPPPAAVAKEPQYLVHPDMLVTIPVRAAEVRKPRDVNKPVLIRGDLKIGTTMETLCVNVGGTEESPIPFITYDEEQLFQITNTIQDISCEIEARPKPNYVEVGDVVYAKSKEDNIWYRSMVQLVNDDEVEVYFFDWGLTEGINLVRIRRLTEMELGLSKSPACAVRVKFSNEPGPLVDEALNCEKRFSMKVESYDDSDESYTVTILKILDMC